MEPAAGVQIQAHMSDSVPPCEFEPIASIDMCMIHYVERLHSNVSVLLRLHPAPRHKHKQFTKEWRFSVELI